MRRYGLNDIQSITLRPSALTGGGRKARSGLVKLSAVLMLSAAVACASPEEKVERYTTSGQEFLEKDELGRANVQFRNALKIEEQHVPALEGLVEIAERKQNVQQMFGLLQRIVRVDPTNVQANIDLAKIYLLGSDETQALETIDRALEIDSENPDAIAAKAAILFRLEDTEEALALARRALELKPGSQEAATVIASDLIKRKEFDAALAQIDATLAADPKAAVLHLLRLKILTDLGREDDIRPAYLGLIEEYPEEVGFRRLYATRLIADNDLPQAREQLLEITKIAPNDTQAFNDVVRLDYRIGGADLADQTYRGFIDQRPNDLELKFGYAAYLRSAERDDGARAVYEGLAALKGDENEATVFRAKNELAAMALASQDRDTAERYVNEIIANDERNSDALMKRASLKLIDEDTTGAINDLRLVIADEPDLHMARMLLGSAYELSGEVAAAESEMAQAVEAGGKTARLSGIFARFLARNGKIDRAERVLADSLSVDASDPDNLKLLAALRLQKQDWRGAQEAAALLERAEGGDAVVNRILGAAYTGLEDYSGAIESLTRATDAEPLDSRPLVGLVNAYVESGRADEAEELLRKRIETDPSDYNVRLLMARVLASQDRVGEAKETLRQAVDIDSGRTEAFELLYRIYRNEGRVDDAEAMLEQGIESAPLNDGLHILLADLRIYQGRSAEALGIYEDVLSRRPRDLIAANNYAAILSESATEQADLDKAVAVAEVLKDSDNAAFLDTYGWALYKAGRRDEGVRVLNRAAEVSPTLMDARFHLGVAYAEMGDMAAARPHLETVIARSDANPEQVTRARALLAN